MALAVSTNWNLVNLGFGDNVELARDIDAKISLVLSKNCPRRKLVQKLASSSAWRVYISTTWFYVSFMESLKLCLALEVTIQASQLGKFISFDDSAE